MLLCNVLSMDDEDMEIDRLVGRLDLFLSFHGFVSGWSVFDLAIKTTITSSG